MVPCPSCSTSTWHHNVQSPLWKQPQQVTWRMKYCIFLQFGKWGGGRWGKQGLQRDLEKVAPEPLSPILRCASLAWIMTSPSGPGGQRNHAIRQCSAWEVPLECTGGALDEFPTDGGGGGGKWGGGELRVRASRCSSGAEGGEVGVETRVRTEPRCRGIRGTAQLLSAIILHWLAPTWKTATLPPLLAPTSAPPPPPPSDHVFRIQAFVTTPISSFLVLPQFPQPFVHFLAPGCVCVFCMKFASDTREAVGSDCRSRSRHRWRRIPDFPCGSLGLWVCVCFMPWVARHAARMILSNGAPGRRRKMTSSSPGSRSTELVAGAPCRKEPVPAAREPLDSRSAECLRSSETICSHLIGFWWFCTRWMFAICRPVSWGSENSN